MSGLGKPHFSPSSLDMVVRCGMQYYYRYIEGIKRPPGISLILGRATHTSVEENLKNKLSAGTLLETEHVQDLARDAATEALEDEVSYTAEEENEGIAKVAAACVDSSVSLATLHHSELAPKIPVTAVEKQFRVEIDGGAYDLEGFIDIVEPDGIADTKTSKKSPVKDLADKSLQLTAYAMSEYVEGGFDQIPTVRLDYLVNTKTKKSVSLESTRAPVDFQSLLDRIGVIGDAVSKGVFIPAKQDDWVCSAKWCGYYDICPYGRRGRSRH